VSVPRINEDQYKVLQTYELDGGTVDLCVETAALELASETGQDILNPPLLIVRKESDGGTNG